MTFRPDAVLAFEQLFDQYKSHIRQQPGCLHLQLWQSETASNVFFTYSHWENAASLEAYRNSVLFKEVWPATKMLFMAKAEAWSVQQKVVMP